MFFFGYGFLVDNLVEVDVIGRLDDLEGFVGVILGEWRVM